jgi:hypothetical protein
MSFQILDDDEVPSETVEFTVRITGSTDDIGRLLDFLSASTHPRVEFDPPGWTKTFYGFELDVWNLT